MLPLVVRRIIAVLLFAFVGALCMGVLYTYRNAIRAYLFSNEVTVTIPEGSTAEHIDALLVEKGVITVPGSFTEFAHTQDKEGYLFPDTYRFHRETAPQAVIDRLTRTFNEKAGPLLKQSLSDAREIVIMASLLEREVPDHTDRRIVAGVLFKRLRADKLLQVDASLCYLKDLATSSERTPCYPLTRLDLQTDSPYNTYLYKGLPPGPIGNPGLDALQAALDAQPSPYWFYLSDPATGRTIFSTTGEEHEANRKKYLGD